MLQVGLIIIIMMIWMIIMSFTILFEIRMLLKSGADSNLEMEDGRTPIHIAAEVIIIVQLLQNSFIQIFFSYLMHTHTHYI